MQTLGMGLIGGVLLFGVGVVILACGVVARWHKLTRRQRAKDLAVLLCAACIVVGGVNGLLFGEGNGSIGVALITALFPLGFGGLVVLGRRPAPKPRCLTVEITARGTLQVDGGQKSVAEVIEWAKAGNLSVTRVYVRQAFAADTLPRIAIDLYAELGNNLVRFETITTPPSS